MDAKLTLWKNGSRGLLSFRKPVTMVCCWDQFSVRHYFSYVYINNLNEDVRGMCNNFAMVPKLVMLWTVKRLSVVTTRYIDQPESERRNGRWNLTLTNVNWCIVGMKVL